jgi:hypothetical protein
MTIEKRMNQLMRHAKRKSEIGSARTFKEKKEKK